MNFLFVVFRLPTLNELGELFLGVGSLAWCWNDKKLIFFGVRILLTDLVYSAMTIVRTGG